MSFETQIDEESSLQKAHESLRMQILCIMLSANRLGLPPHSSAAVVNKTRVLLVQCYGGTMHCEVSERDEERDRNSRHCSMKRSLTSECFAAKQKTCYILDIFGSATVVVTLR